jgi:hypothetical protein
MSSRTRAFLVDDREYFIGDSKRSQHANDRVSRPIHSSLGTFVARRRQKPSSTFFAFLDDDVIFSRRSLALARRRRVLCTPFARVALLPKQISTPTARARLARAQSAAAEPRPRARRRVRSPRRASSPRARSASVRSRAARYFATRLRQSETPRPVSSSCFSCSELGSRFGASLRIAALACSRSASTLVAHALS